MTDMTREEIQTAVRRGREYQAAWIRQKMGQVAWGHVCGTCLAFSSALVVLGLTFAVFYVYAR